MDFITEKKRPLYVYNGGGSSDFKENWLKFAENL